jgi:hypothetical protein
LRAAPRQNSPLACSKLAAISMAAEPASSAGQNLNQTIGVLCGRER